MTGLLCGLFGHRPHVRGIRAIPLRNVGRYIDLTKHGLWGWCIRCGKRWDGVNITAAEVADSDAERDGGTCEAKQ